MIKETKKRNENAVEHGKCAVKQTPFTLEFLIKGSPGLYRPLLALGLCDYLHPGPLPVYLHQSSWYSHLKNRQ